MLSKIYKTLVSESHLLVCGLRFSLHVCLTLHVQCRIKLSVVSSVGVLDKTETLTPLGERVACMSCDPRLGKVLVLSAVFRCVLPMLAVAACLTRNPFYNSLQDRAQVNKVRCVNTHLLFHVVLK